MTVPPTQKKRHVVSFENMSEELAAAFNEKYPKGFSDFFPELVKYTKPDGSTFEAVTVETDDEICLVKIKVKTDDPEALERWLERGDDEDVDEGSSAEGDNPLPDDNISQYGGDDDSQDA